MLCYVAQKNLVRFAALSALLASVSACSSDSNDRPAVKTAASGQGGTTASAGTGGSGAAGSSSAGTSSTTGATGGSAGTRAGSNGGSSNGGGGTSGDTPGSSGAPTDDGGSPPVNNTPSGTPPALTAGKWTNITPAGVNLKSGCCTQWPSEGLNGDTFGLTGLEVDPLNPYTLYVLVDVQGIWKSTDGGTSWRRLGTPPAQPSYDTSVSYLDSPLNLRVDPKNSDHLYATQGVRGASLGFWESFDGGDTWAMPAGFVAILQKATNDVTSIAVDPSDFKHVLLGSHSPWNFTENAGILETRDGGKTFIMHKPPASWPLKGSPGVSFYYSPKYGIGNAQTWIVNTDGDGTWRTTDSGDTWEKVADFITMHGGVHEIYITKDGTAYGGGEKAMLRGTNGGKDWTTVGPSTPDGYYQVIGDGNLLYASPANTGASTTGPQPYFTSPESDGMTWSAYDGGKQTFDAGPFTMRLDSVNGILYSANWLTGLWALKIPKP